MHLSMQAKAYSYSTETELKVIDVLLNFKKSFLHFSFRRTIFPSGNKYKRSLCTFHMQLLHWRKNIIVYAVHFYCHFEKENLWLFQRKLLFVGKWNKAKKGKLLATSLGIGICYKMHASKSFCLLWQVQIINVNAEYRFNIGKVLLTPSSYCVTFLKKIFCNKLWCKQRERREMKTFSFTISRWNNSLPQKFHHWISMFSFVIDMQMKYWMKIFIWILNLSSEIF